MTTASPLSQREHRKVGADFQSTLQSLGLQQNWLADQLGVAETTVYRWCAGDVPLPQYAVAFVEQFTRAEAEGAALRLARSYMKGNQLEHAIVFIDGKELKRNRKPVSLGEHLDRIVAEHAPATEAETPGPSKP